MRIKLNNFSGEKSNSVVPKSEKLIAPCIFQKCDQ